MSFMNPISITVKIRPSTTGDYWIELPSSTPFTLHAPDLENLVTLLRQVLGCHFHSPTDPSAVGETAMASSIQFLPKETLNLPVIR